MFNVRAQAPGRGSAAKTPQEEWEDSFSVAPSMKAGRDITAVEDVSSRASQWWTNGGLYLGQEVADLLDKSHALRSPWDLTGEIIPYRQDRHVLTIGPNGSGKTRRLLFPNLYRLKDWSIAAIDPKGELFAHTAAHRAATGSRIILLDPFAVVKTNYPHLAKRFPVESSGFNPVAALDPTSPRFVDQAKSLAVALIQTEAEREKYWSQAAQALVKGLLMGLRIEAGGEACLPLLREVLGLEPQQLADECARLVAVLGKQCPALAASLSEFTTYSAQDRELGGVRRTAKVQTDWLDSPEVGEDLKKGAFDFATIKDQPTTIYLVLPPEYLASHGTWLRIMVSSILRPLLRSVEGRAVPVLFLLDEFAQLGHMEIVEDNYALMRGYGVKLWTVWQDLNQAKILYKDRWESFISNAGIVQAFAPQDMTTRKYLSDLADERMTWIDKESKSSNVTGVNVSGGTSTAPANIKELLIYPYELGQMQQGQSVLFTARGNVLRSYFPDAAAKGFAGVADMMAEAARNMRP